MLFRSRYTRADSEPYGTPYTTLHPYTESTTDDDTLDLQRDQGEDELVQRAFALLETLRG